MKELLSKRKSLMEDVSRVDSQLNKIQARRGEHSERLIAHEMEADEADQRLSGVIRDVARNNASDKDLARAQATVDSLKSKGASLVKILEVVDEDIQLNLQAKAEKEQELARVMNNIARTIASDLLGQAMGSLVDAYAIHRVFWAQNGRSALSMVEWLRTLAVDVPIEGRSEDYVKARGREILDKALK